MIYEPVLNASVMRNGFMNLDYFGQQRLTLYSLFIP